MIKTVFYFLIFLAANIFASASQAAPFKNTPVIDNGEPKAAQLWQALKALENGQADQPLRIVQLGDSHTAGDFFSGRLRQHFQTRFGDAGLGWLTPGYILNQRSDTVLMSNKGGWTLSDSKQQKHSGLFPLGGLFQSAASASVIEIKPRADLGAGSWNLSIWQQANKVPWRFATEAGEVFRFPLEQSAGWQLSSLRLNGQQPKVIKLLAPSGGKLAGVALDKNALGVTLDAMGITGATANAISRWDDASLQAQLAWRDPQLIILAYGTNEAFDPDIKETEYEAELRNNIQRLRHYAPNAAVLLIGLPSAAKKRAPNIRAKCSLPLPPSYFKIQTVQQRVAKQEHLLYWDWSNFMGGSCGAQTWIKQKPALMRPDLIHMSAEGYWLSADELFDELMKLLGKSK